MDDSSIAGANSANDSVDINIGVLNSSDSRISIDDSVNNSPDTFAGGLNSSDSRISLDVSGNDLTAGFQLPDTRDSKRDKTKLNLNMLVQHSGILVEKYL